MKRQISKSVSLLILVALAGCGEVEPQRVGEDITGVWTGSWGNLSDFGIMSFTQKLQQIDGTISGTMGNDKNHSRVIGSVEGNRVDLEVETTESEKPILFYGTVSGDRIDGEWMFGTVLGGWSATRVAEGRTDPEGKIRRTSR